MKPNSLLIVDIIAVLRYNIAINLINCYFVKHSRARRPEVLTRWKLRESQESIPNALNSLSRYVFLYLPGSYDGVEYS